MDLGIKKIVNGKWKENCYIITSPVQLENAIIIDPGSTAMQIIDYIKTQQLKIVGIINTHAHYDHIGAVEDLKNEYSIPFYLHSKDLKLLKHANLYSKIFDGDGPIPIPEVDFYFDQIECSFLLGGFHIDVFYTPGHTEGSVCLQIGNNLFTGDTLFQGKIGRTDLPGSNKSSLNSSLKQLSQLSPKLNIFPGHGESSTIGKELESNHEFLDSIQ
jgi:hydroxyacylglutathione hydrolase